MFEGEKQIEDFLLSWNEFELPNFNSKSDENCLDKKPPDEEKPFPIVEINMLTREFESQSEEYINSNKEDIEVL